MTAISFMSANYVAREVGYAMHGWGHGDRATNDAFRPLETYEQRLDAVLRDVRALGFDAIDLWGAHLNPAWATDEHVAVAQRLLARHGLAVASLEVFVGPAELERTCDIATAVGTTVIAGFAPLDDPRLLPLLREHGLRVAIENHPEKTPDELLAKLVEDDSIGACVDTGWFATQGYDPVRALDEVGGRLLHVHLKDVLAAGAHDTCRWGDGIVDVVGCVDALRRIGYDGAVSVEHEPEHYDPSDDCRTMLAQLRRWLS